MKIIGMDMRQMALTITLLLTLAATVYVWHNDHLPQNSTPLVTTSKNRSALVNVQAKTAATPAQAGTPNTRALTEVSNDIFAVTKVADKEQKAADVEPPPALPILEQVKALPTLPVTEVAPKPTVPPLPFKYIGKLGDVGQYSVFLSAQNKNYVVKTRNCKALMPAMDLSASPTPSSC